MTDFSFRRTAEWRYRFDEYIANAVLDGKVSEQIRALAIEAADAACCELISREEKL